MLSLDEIRGLALPLPGVEQSTHLGLPCFTVGGEVFVALEESRSTVVAAVDEDDAASVVAGDADLYEEVWRDGTTFAGVRIDLARAPAGQVRRLIEAAWRNKAPAELRGRHGG